MNDLALAQLLREKIMADPEMILGDHDLMRALMAANQQSLGANVVDLRGVAMDRLEQRLDRLEDTHRTVIAAAYDNLSGTNQIHRAVSKLLEPADFRGFLALLTEDVANILRVESMCLVLEAATDHGDRLADLGEALCIVPPGFIDEYMSGDHGRSSRRVVLRRIDTGTEAVHGSAASRIRSEALMRLDLGEGRLPGLLVLGAGDPASFRPSQGTDLLNFFTDVFERLMRRWLALA